MSAEGFVKGESFVAPYSGNLYAQCVGGSAGATSQLWIGVSLTNFSPYLTGLPASCPTAEVEVGTVTAGQTVQFGLSTVWNGKVYWASSSGTDQASIVAFTDVCNSLGMGGNIFQQTSATTWVMHLNDAAHYTLSQCEANNILVQLRLAASPPAFGVVLPQFVSGGGWYSALYFTNTGSSAVSFPISFIADNGTPLSVPVVGSSSTVVNIAPLGTAAIQTANIGPVSQGYASVSLPAGVFGYGVFHLSNPGVPDQEAVVPLSSALSTVSTLTWDDTSFVTAVAIVNPSSFATTVSIVLRDSVGATIGTSSVFLPASNKTEAVLRNLPGLGAMVGNRGSAVFTVTTGNVAVLGLRFIGSAFTSIPPVGN